MARPAPHLSAIIQNSDRAGRAPYNFVPLSSGPWLRAEKPPEGDQFHEHRLSGYVDFELTAQTDFYTRGMWTLQEFQRKADDDKQPLPFQVAGKLRLPGSSLRGMIRTLVEILSFGPLGKINETQMFFRTVASVPDPDNRRSFEPHAKAYKLKLLKGTDLIVKAGYLYASREGWRIRPSTADPSTGKQWYRYRTSESWVRRKVRFDPERFYARIHESGREEGWLVCSGRIPGKQKQWVVRAESTGASTLELSPELVTAYKETGISRDIEKNRFDYTDGTRGLPVFYVLDDRGRVSAFGHTPHMRMPYARRPPDTIPEGQRKLPSEWDMAESIFGRVKSTDVEGFRGRVFFEDGLLLSGGDLDSEKKVILGQPKPTTYQHYLVQTKEAVDKVVHWDGDVNLNGRPTLRGNKLYWHRIQVPLPIVKEKDNVATRFRPARKGARFRARIRFENLTNEELGCLICALILEPGCAHKLGMAKPLGFGSFQLENLQLYLQNATSRYSSLFDPDGRLSTGESVATSQDVMDFQDRFAAWALSEPAAKIADLWEHPRILELRALLTFSDLQKRPEWWNRTRYLEFGKVRGGYANGRNYNEYLEVGHPDRPPMLQKRRPLPPASQVLSGRNVPATPRPDFE